jgi:DNA-directed RNA polymerase subunit M/transcription elongation factor TFIIS
MSSKAQRNTKIQPEMETSTKKPAAKRTKKAAPAPAPPQSIGGGGSVPDPGTPTLATALGQGALADEPVNQGIPEGGLATPFTQFKEELPNHDAEEPSQSSLRYCPVCENYLYMQVDAESQELRRVCRKCGFKEEDAKGGLVMEMMIQQKSSEGYKILLNEFTRKDPRLPHIRKNITCPNTSCDSNKGGKEPDVIYIKYDVVNLMYLYICDICGEQWHSRSRS